MSKTTRPESAPASPAMGHWAANQGHGRINCRSSLEETNPVTSEIQEIMDAAFGRDEPGCFSGIFKS